MKGLLLKDWYTLIKQMKLMLLILLVFACMPGYSLPVFAVFYASMLPVTALAYDERSKWDELAIMMPYSAKDIVLSKYVLGLLAIFAAAIVAAAAQVVFSLISKRPYDYSELMGLLLIVCLSIILLAVNLPLMFRMGVEKGRIGFMILVCGGVVCGMALRDVLLDKINSIPNIAPSLLILLAVTVAVFFFSAPLSVRMYQKRMG